MDSRKPKRIYKEDGYYYVYDDGTEEKIWSFDEHKDREDIGREIIKFLKADDVEKLIFSKKKNRVNDSRDK